LHIFVEENQYVILSRWGGKSFQRIEWCRVPLLRPSVSQSIAMSF